MKNLIRIFAISSIILGLAPAINAQDKSTKAEFECLMMANSSRNGIPSEQSQFVSFHHVWTPELKYGYFKSNGLDLVYEVEGAGEETVIVVPGGPGLPHEYFHPAMSSLSRYVKLVYFDRRADILSSRSAYEMASPDDMAEDIDALRRALNLSRVTLLAHSYGGAIALTYALRYPEHLKRLILVSTSAAVENPLAVEARLLKVLSPEEMNSYRSSEGIAGAGSPCERVHKLYRALYPRYFYKAPNSKLVENGWYAIYFDALARKQLIAGDAGGFDVTAQLGNIKAPTLVIAGRYDLVTPIGMADTLAGGLPHSKLAVLEHSGHFPFLEENYLFTEWVRQFISSTVDAKDDRSSSGVAVMEARSN